VTGNEPGDLDHEDAEYEAEERERRRAYNETRAALHADLPFADHEAYEHGRTTHE